MNKRIIGHVDMDAFFAAVEERDNDRLKGRPIVIGADPKNGQGRGVVSTANYVARKYGIHSAMPISRAWKNAEEARRKGGDETVFLAGNFPKYRKASGEVMGILSKHSRMVEIASIDEAYVDLGHCEEFETAEELAKNIKKEIFKTLKLTASIGLGPNKLVAKIASDMEKPNGLTVIRPKEVESFLAPLNIRKIPGIGPKAEEILLSKGIKTISELRGLSKQELEDFFGIRGVSMYNKARGIDNAPLSEGEEAKSIGEQETFLKDTRDMGYIAERISNLASSVMKRFENSDFRSFNTVVVTVRFTDFTTRSKSKTLDVPANEEYNLAFQALNMFMPFMDSRENPKGQSIRLIGVRLEKLE